MADDGLFGQDGTQAPTPPELLVDPLGGLVTGYIPAPEDTGLLRPVRVVPAKPQQLDPQAIQRVVDEVMAEPTAKPRIVRDARHHAQPVPASQVVLRGAASREAAARTRRGSASGTNPAKKKNSGSRVITVIIVIVVLFFLLRTLGATLSNLFH